MLRIRSWLEGIDMGGGREEKRGDIQPIVITGLRSLGSPVRRARVASWEGGG